MFHSSHTVNILPAIISPKISTKSKSKLLFSETCLTTQKLKRPNPIMFKHFNSTQVSSKKNPYLFTKINFPKPCDVHSNIVLKAAHKAKKNSKKQSLSESSSSLSSIEINDEIVDVILPRTLKGDHVKGKNMDIAMEYERDLDRKTQNVLRNELLKANNKLNCKYGVKPITRSSQIIVKPSKGKSMRMSVEYQIAKNETKLKTKKAITKKHLFSSMIHDLNFVSKLYLQHQNPILQINREATHINVVKDTEIMGDLLLDNFNRIYK